MRPVLRPALRRIWRDAHTLQIGTVAERALLLQLDAAAVRFLDAFDGSRETGDLLDHADALGMAPADGERLLDALATHGALEDAAAAFGMPAPARDFDAFERERLRPDLAALGLRSPRPDHGLATLRRRRLAAVAVHGLGRVGAQIAHQLASAGVGHVVPVDSAPVGAVDVVPGGFSSAHVGMSRQDALRDLLASIAPGARTQPPAHADPDIAVVTAFERWPTRITADLMARDIPHLVVLLHEDVARLGPLVVPGRTSCQRCHDMHRADADPCWPRILAQLSGDHDPQPAHALPDTRDLACDASLATLAATYATLHTLAHLDGEEPPSVDATLELALPWGEIGRRTWTPHPACGCTGLAFPEPERLLDG